jgi:hypothetical protein
LRAELEQLAPQDFCVFALALRCSGELTDEQLTLMIEMTERIGMEAENTKQDLLAIQKHAL